MAHILICTEGETARALIVTEGESLRTEQRVNKRVSCSEFAAASSSSSLRGLLADQQRVCELLLEVESGVFEERHFSFLVRPAAALNTRAPLQRRSIAHLRLQRGVERAPLLHNTGDKGQIGLNGAKLLLLLIASRRRKLQRRLHLCSSATRERQVVRHIFRLHLCTQVAGVRRE